MERMKVLLIVPAYNEEKNIVKTVETIQQAQKDFMEHVELDYLVVNDGSTDQTEEICKEHGFQHITLVDNLGIGGAVQTGYIYADRHGYDVAVQFDGDGQHDIQGLPQLLEPLATGEWDFTVGSRFLQEGSSGFHSTAARRMGIRLLSFLIKLVSGERVQDVTSGFRAANKRVIRAFAADYPVDYPEPESLISLSKQGFRIKEVPVNMFERTGGVSSISFFKSIYYMIKVTLAILCAAARKGEVEK